MRFEIKKRKIKRFEIMRYTIQTLGCKVNQVDSIFVAEALDGLGLQKAALGEPADLCIVNTCTVTARSDTQCRQMIRKAVRENPGARVVVTGCYAEMDPNAVRAIPGVTMVVGSRDKRRIPEMLAGNLNADKVGLEEENGPRRPEDLSAACLRDGRQVTPAQTGGQRGRESSESQRLIQGAGGRSRAFVMVQDGCRAFCAYCIVPQARGPFKSVDAEQVENQVRALIEKGFPEIVLTGIHLGAYGVDRHERRGLQRLILRLIRIPGDFRIRLSSIEPAEVDDELIHLITGEEKLCNHLHIPVQSGDDAILRRMRRPYTTDAFFDLVFRLRARDPEMGIGTDLIVGLPGETGGSFERTCRWIASLPLTHFHIFPYSQRPGTEAYAMDGQVDQAAKKERAARLREICRAMQVKFLSGMKGKTLRAVPTSKPGPANKTLSVLTGNYLSGRLMDPYDLPSGIFSVKVSGISDDKLLVYRVR
ncbi:MAG: tRNA (N(6)-L-threonylcarbamoyladenosine(37)-C(2))-methylthiotransferase MtaB [Nitrospirae bacterium CG_4_9_14_3_um_filter_53_35]|nr:MAG: tRNA (N(6)-L-threonylcarbamoyladenosine(37)-C(2))-methylthiotransferase MtaB [Nitrospirae bacterium CG2_30_53_67]PIS36692.1 MAG: tRNA (N(6)-L-threonylcarbamoyladenosine(37)-C(2))-methylthiotransferase MtaB [Nitrospirae bacterium CG08_land_8_20_14_0_20_52_24]PIX86826.1 MAG: tRNA (N(6)-L-threonylcarbamoyladenosine(37)-C(2))-methylthiotransferase MtaB [Nitrospirae bacterium CG_4_10_14_3_um_filter_53_41]PJA75251.1 MAG: tRNA (N(6)-L-threonylcarbamoyladenosine(37)-C(2))-methylthiotransferase M